MGELFAHIAEASASDLEGRPRGLEGEEHTAYILALRCFLHPFVAQEETSGERAAGTDEANMCVTWVLRLAHI